MQHGWLFISDKKLLLAYTSDNPKDNAIIYFEQYSFLFGKIRQLKGFNKSLLTQKILKNAILCFIYTKTKFSLG